MYGLSSRGAVLLSALTCIRMRAKWREKASPAPVQARKPRGVELWFNITLMIVYGVAGVLAAIG